MSKKNIENHIPRAIEVLQAKFDDTIPSSYNGYISSFGASVIQSGLKATVALFENKNASTEQDKTVLMKIILEILDETAQGTLLEYILNSQNETLEKEKILDIAVAIKLSIRTFKLEKGG
jgi:CRISPR-associated protein Cmr5